MYVCMYVYVSTKYFSLSADNNVPMPTRPYCMYCMCGFMGEGMYVLVPNVRMYVYIFVCGVEGR